MNWLLRIKEVIINIFAKSERLKLAAMLLAASFSIMYFTGEHLPLMMTVFFLLGSLGSFKE